MVPISLNSIDVQHQQRSIVRLVWGSQPPDDPNIEAPLDVGVALHSSTLSSLSPRRIAVLSTKNVQWVGSHRRIKKLESLADRIAADSAVSSDLSPDSAASVTPRVKLPWFECEGHVDRFSRFFHSGGILGQRLPLPRPVYLAVSEDSSVGIDGLDADDGYVSDGTCVCRRDWVGFPRAPSIRRLLVQPSHCYRAQLPGFREHPPSQG